MVKSSTERTDAAIPEALRQIGEVIRASGAAHTTTARSLVAYYGEERRGDVVVERIRADLALLGLVARPDFELAYIDAEIELVPAAAGTDASSGDDVASGTDAVLPGALTTRAGAADPVVRIGMLRAAGMSRSQVWRSVLVEAGILGAIGGIVGSIAGVVIGLLLSGGGGAAGPLAAIPWTTAALAIVLGVAISMLAAAQPARMAGRVPIVVAVRGD